MTDLQQPQTGAEPAEGAPTVPSATVVADSVSPDGVRVTTIEVTLHRFVLAELNTHRVFSRNSASSRAIPIGKQIARVETDPAMPVEFGANQRGMQAGAVEGVRRPEGTSKKAPRSSRNDPRKAQGLIRPCKSPIRPRKSLTGPL